MDIVIENEDGLVTELMINCRVQGASASMFIVLPDEPLGLQDVLKGLYDNATIIETLDERFSSIRPRQLVVAMPKFRIEHEQNMRKPLEDEFKMTDMFKEGVADLKGISDEQLFVSETKQKSLIEVTETGTEAAAVSSVVIVNRIGGGPGPFTADHPFLFFVRDNVSKAILFMGQYSVPDDA